VLTNRTTSSGQYFVHLRSLSYWYREREHKTHFLLLFNSLFDLELVHLAEELSIKPMCGELDSSIRAVVTSLSSFLDLASVRGTYQ
jgi:hypothetical protein